MATVTTTCPSCRLRARLSADEIVLRTGPSEDASGTWLSFLCHTCETLANTPVSAAARHHLIEAGIPVERMARAPERALVRRPFCLDDLLDLHLLLDSPGWFEQLEQLTTADDRRERCPDAQPDAQPDTTSLQEEHAS